MIEAKKWFTNILNCSDEKATMGPHIGECQGSHTTHARQGSQ